MAKSARKASANPAPLPEDQFIKWMLDSCQKAETMIRQHLELLQKPGLPASRQAAIFVALRRACERWAEISNMPGSDQQHGIMGDALVKFKTETIPKAFEAENLSSFTLDTGYRVGLNERYNASIKKDMKNEAYEWLRGNGLGDLITETVNASTLSAAGKALVENEGKELPEQFFNAFFQTTASVTKTK